MKHLAREHLGISIQTGCHDSAEDARAALALVKKKVKYGPKFGIGEKLRINLFE